MGSARPGPASVHIRSTVTASHTPLWSWICSQTVAFQPMPAVSAARRAGCAELSFNSAALCIPNKGPQTSRTSLRFPLHVRAWTCPHFETAQTQNSANGVKIPAKGGWSPGFVSTAVHEGIQASPSPDGLEMGPSADGMVARAGPKPLNTPQLRA
jgi:hypothetical protein